MKNILFQIIEDLEERIIRMREAQSIKYQKDLQKMKLKYEILARNQINSRLSEMNEFFSSVLVGVL